MRFLDAGSLRAALPMPRAIETMRAAFGPDRETPPRTRVGASLFMPGRVGDVSGIKVVSTVPGNPAGIVVVFGPDGAPLGLVDGPTLTAIRTGAGCGLATDLMAAGSVSTMAMLGAGSMAADQVAAVRAVRPIDRVRVWSRAFAHAEALAERIGAEPVADPDEAVAGAEVVTTATPARAPIFSAAAIAPGTHLNAVGAFTPAMVELPAQVVRQAFVAVDDREAAAAEAGDLLQAEVEPDADMAEMLAGRRPPQGATTVFKSVGISSQDVAAALGALQTAEADNLGVIL